jgi:hypothetical protein
VPVFFPIFKENGKCNRRPGRALQLSRTSGKPDAYQQREVLLVFDDNTYFEF